jgi:hypothetical protein
MWTSRPTQDREGEGAVDGNLKREFQYYLDHQEDLVQKYEGRFIVIKNEEVIGDYPSALSAVQETAKKHELGSFLIQKCSPGSEGHTQLFHSRVSFACRSV